MLISSRKRVPEVLSEMRVIGKRTSANHKILDPETLPAGSILSLVCRIKVFFKNNQNPGLGSHRGGLPPYRGNSTIITAQERQTSQARVRKWCWELLEAVDHPTERAA